MKKISFLKLAKIAAAISLDKKGEDIILLNVKKLTALANYFLIVSVDSAPQMKAISETIQRTLREKSRIKPIHTEGLNTSFWSVLDYGGLVIHLMLPQARSFYALERIWADARHVKVNG